MGGAASADAPVQVLLGGGADEVVVAARMELQAAGLRRERPERYREVHRFKGLVADRYDPRTRIRYPTRFVLLFRHLQNNARQSTAPSRQNLSFRSSNFFFFSRSIVTHYISYLNYAERSLAQAPSKSRCYALGESM